MKSDCNAQVIIEKMEKGREAIEHLKKFVQRLLIEWIEWVTISYVYKHKKHNTSQYALTPNIL